MPALIKLVSLIKVVCGFRILPLIKSIPGAILGFTYDVSYLLIF